MALGTGSGELEDVSIIGTNGNAPHWKVKDRYKGRGGLPISEYDRKKAKMLPLRKPYVKANARISPCGTKIEVDASTIAGSSMAGSSMAGSSMAGSSGGGILVYNPQLSKVGGYSIYFGCKEAKAILRAHILPHFVTTHPAFYEKLKRFCDEEHPGPTTPPASPLPPVVSNLPSTLQHGQCLPTYQNGPGPQRRRPVHSSAQQGASHRRSQFRPRTGTANAEPIHPKRHFYTPY
ncbi:hypothetical protein BJ508DRAFT_330218 [Ascobolus immersus RN42]|uniref:Uncharacterized protein n=1 Tax=Ascobolus immersus RN42 TaxID=1160509 RepID=A0A3N4HU65_ASCIM|nr:hypothetical protein BJ508DRAFT_330218 [Ascobolus immersus RN42]